MTKRLTLTLVALALFVLLAVLPVSATTYNATNITRGDTVFVGESGLNVTLAAPPAGGLNNVQIAWFPSTAQSGATTPEKVIDITATNTSFYVNPADFSTRTGNWYCWTPGMFLGPTAAGPGAPLAFYVLDPQLDVKIWDLTQNTDVSGKSVTVGQPLSFRVETNTYTVAARPNISGPINLGPVTWTTSSMNSYYGVDPYGSAAVNSKTPEGWVQIRVKTPEGNTLSGLFNSSLIYTSTVSIPLTGMFVDKLPWLWGNYTTTAPARALFWNTSSLDEIGQKIYPAGTYTVYGELDLNKIKDNYKNAGADYTGKTISESRTITLVSDSVKITANKDTVTRSKAFSVTVTGKPATSYWVWVKGVTQMKGGKDDQAPMIALNQLSVTNDTYPTLVSNPTTGPSLFIPEKYWTAAGTPANMYNTQYNISTNNNVPTDPFSGTRYWAKITTNDAGTRVIEWVTSNQTKAQKYTIRVEARIAGEYKTDEVDVKVEKGTVTITAAGDGSYYLGEDVSFSGTNTETAKTYLFITGPNLPPNGGNINDQNPRNPDVAPANNVPANFKVLDVLGDNTWSWKWATSTVALDAGTYTVYAVSGPNVANNLGDVAYGTVSIIIKKPFVSATVSSSTVARGDSLFVRGIAEGKPSKGVQMWVLGKNYPQKASDITTAAVNADATFEFEIKDSTTKNLAAGQYFVVVQHPMQNDEFDIRAKTGSPATTTGVFNMQLGPDRATGLQVFTLLGAGSLQGSDAAEALVQALTDPNVDDTYTKLQFLIEEPVIRIDPIGDKHVGDKFTIRAQTNFAVGDEVLFEVYSSSFKPTQKTQSGEFSGATGTTKVTKGLTGMNALAFDVDAATFKPDEYIVKATAVVQGTTGTALFNVLEGAAPTAAPTAVATTAAPTAAPTAPPTAVATPTKTPTQPGFGALVALIGLGAVAFLVVRKH